MPLSKRKKGERTTKPLPAGVVNRVQLSPYRVVLAGVQTWRVDYQPLTKEITAVGYVEFNERGVKNVSARVNGPHRQAVRQRNRADGRCGRRAGLALQPRPGRHGAEPARRPANAATAELLDSARNRLAAAGHRATIRSTRFWQTGKANTHLKIRSPISGHVIKKYVREGQYVEEGTPLYDVADLSTVWIQAQVYEDDLAFLPLEQRTRRRAATARARSTVTATTRAFPNEAFHGKLTFIYPHVDQDTRTVTVRFELDNPGPQAAAGQHGDGHARRCRRKNVPLLAASRRTIPSARDDARAGPGAGRSGERGHRHRQPDDRLSRDDCRACSRACRSKLGPRMVGPGRRAVLSGARRARRRATAS